MGQRINVRSFNKKGIEKFKEFLILRRQDLNAHIEAELLTSEDYSRVIAPHVEIERRSFSSGYEMARYLNDEVGLHAALTGDDSGLWTWLTAFYADVVIEPGKPPKASVRYIPEGADNFQRYYRHLIASPFNVYRIHREKSLMLLYRQPFMFTDFMEQLAARQEFITNEGVFVAIYELFFDSSAGKPFKGAASRGRPGTLRRFIDLMQQLDLTFDLYGMTASQITGLLPSEFKLK